MYNASDLIGTFHDDYVRLSLKQSQDMQRRRDANIDRLAAGLRELEKPSIAETINQGGNAMQTMTQPPENDTQSRYDIDMGVVFEASDTTEPRTVKGWVCSALEKKATDLKSPPEAKKKCVRVIYADGYQCDFPVFKRTKVGNAYSYEIALGDGWVASDPQAVNAWFAAKIKELSPNEESGFQLRRIVRLLKHFAKVHAHRTSRKFPAGLVVTALAVECYAPVEGRDDEAFYETLQAVARRSERAAVYANGTAISGSKDPERIKRLCEAASEAVNALGVLVDAQVATEEQARKSWKSVFRHTYFDTSPTDKLETKSAAGAWGAGVAPALIGLSDEERHQRAEAAAREVERRGSSSKPWAK